MKRSTYIWSLLVGCVAFATSCDLTENVQVKADKSMIFGSKSGLELYSNSFYKALPTLKNGFMQDKMCDVGAVSNTDTFIKQGAYNTETATSSRGSRPRSRQRPSKDRFSKSTAWAARSRTEDSSAGCTTRPAGSAY